MQHTPLHHNGAWLLCLEAKAEVAERQKHVRSLEGGPSRRPDPEHEVED